MICELGGLHCAGVVSVDGKGIDSSGGIRVLRASSAAFFRGYSILFYAVL